MKKECDYTRDSLRKYLRGHLFRHEQVRIARHLNSCPVCRSEFQTLKKVADTKQLLKDITPPESLQGRIQAGVSGLGRIKILFYRPLWLIALVGLGVLVYINIASSRRDVEIENIEKTLPSAGYVASAPTATPASALSNTTTAPAAGAAEPGSPVEPPPRPDPLLVTITTADLKAAVSHINNAMQEHSKLRTQKISNSAKEISGSLTAGELIAFLNRIEVIGKIRYNRKKFNSFPAAAPIPFVITMKAVPKDSPEPASLSEHDPAGAAVPPPASAPTGSAP